MLEASGYFQGRSDGGGGGHGRHEMRGNKMGKITLLSAIGEAHVGYVRGRGELIN